VMEESAIQTEDVGESNAEEESEANAGYSADRLEQEEEGFDEQNFSDPGSAINITLWISIGLSLVVFGCWCKRRQERTKYQLEKRQHALHSSIAWSNPDILNPHSGSVAVSVTAESHSDQSDTHSTVTPVCFFYEDETEA